jgi:hypothetical protein
MICVQPRIDLWSRCYPLTLCRIPKHFRHTTWVESSEVGLCLCRVLVNQTLLDLTGVNSANAPSEWHYSNYHIVRTCLHFAPKEGKLLFVPLKLTVNSCVASGAKIRAYCLIEFYIRWRHLQSHVFFRILGSSVGIAYIFSTRRKKFMQCSFGRVLRVLH